MPYLPAYFVWEFAGLTRNYLHRNFRQELLARHAHLIPEDYFHIPAKIT